MEDWKKRWEEFMFTEDMVVGGDTVLNPKPETYGDFVNMLDDIEDFIEEELSKAREEGRREYARELLDDYYQPDSDSIEIDVSEIQSELSKLTTK